MKAQAPEPTQLVDLFVVPCVLAMAMAASVIVFCSANREPSSTQIQAGYSVVEPQRPNPNLEYFPKFSCG
jgi:hypothetical protein